MTTPPKGLREIMRNLGMACGYWNYDINLDGFWINEKGSKKFISGTLAEELGWVIKRDSVNFKEAIHEEMLRRVND